jgi:hypothetical protein
MAKSTSRTVSQRPARVKTAVVISPEAFRRLGAACLAENMTQSELVEALINRSLSGYVVSVRGPGFHAAPVAPATIDDRSGQGVGISPANAAAGL